MKAGDKDQYVEAMRNDGYDDVADVIIGKAVATNDPDPNWSQEHGIVYNGGDVGGKVGGGNYRPQPRPV